jgi:hypothetical protein
MDANPSDVYPGDIYVVTPPAGGMGRLVLVDEVDTDWCYGYLVTTETSLATDIDAILSPEQTGLGHSVAVHFRQRGPVWRTQVGRRAGGVTNDLLREVQMLGWSHSTDLPSGEPLGTDTAHLEPRHTELLLLEHAFASLTDDCSAFIGPET